MAQTLFLLILVQYSLIQIGEGQFQPGSTSKVYYQILGVHPWLRSDEPNAIILYDMRLCHKTNNKIDSIAILKSVRFPLRSIQLHWKQAGITPYSTVLIRDANQHYWIIYYRNGWQVTDSETFLGGLLERKM